MPTYCNRIHFRKICCLVRTSPHIMFKMLKKLIFLNKIQCIVFFSGNQLLSNDLFLYNLNCVFIVPKSFHGLLTISENHSAVGLY